MAVQVIRSEVKYRGRAFQVRVDEVAVRPGLTTRLDIVDHPHSVMMLPLDAENQVWFVRQYRHAAGQVLLELPAGTLKPGEDPAKAANRELQEEIGMRAERLEEIASFYLAPGYSTELMHVFMATGLSASPLPQDDDEDIAIERVPIERVLALAGSGALQDAKSLVGVLAAARRLGWRDSAP
ncbi:MAG: NUDIX hydrolase [Anaerolineales bacterium]|nr:NUDIX hydrolase [Anaerolineales bacterium]